jgi:hypothetical protein
MRNARTRSGERRATLARLRVIGAAFRFTSARRVGDASHYAVTIAAVEVFSDPDRRVDDGFFRGGRGVKYGSTIRRVPQLLRATRTP